VYLKTLICVNWGNLPIRAYALGPTTLLTGGSGSGKTTMADAIQTVMTASKRGLFMYNPGQDEATQYGKGGKIPRSLASYILGADDNNFARPNGAHGYVACIFAPSPGEPDKPGFSAIVAVTASVITENFAAGRRKRTPKEETLQLLIAEDVAVTLQDFIENESATGIEVPAVDKTYTRLKKRYGENTIHTFQNKQHYLNKLYGFFRGKRQVSTAEAEQAARTFSKFMAYKPIDNINDFVKTDVLEPHNIAQDITRISTLMRNVYELREESERLRSNIQWLEQAEQHGRVVRESWFERKEQALCLAFKDLHDTTRFIEHSRQLIDKDIHHEQQLRLSAQDIRRQLEQWDEERWRIERIRQQHDSAAEKDRLDGQIKENRERFQHHFGVVDRQLQIAKHNQEYLKQIVALPVYLREKATLRQAFAALGDHGDALFHYDLTHCAGLIAQMAGGGSLPPAAAAQLREHLSGYDEHYQTMLRLINDENGLRSLSDREVGAVQTQVNELNDQRKDLQRRASKLRDHGRIEYPAPVNQALAAIEEQLPGARAQVLCDLVDMKNTDWQAAIEGYLGWNRFAIIVAEDYESQAIERVRQLPKRGAQVIQGAKALRDAARIHRPPQSIVAELQVEHPVARAYLTAAYGTVVRVDDPRQLRMTPRGLTRHGHASAAYKMFICTLPDHELVFGEGARQKVVDHLHKRLGELDIAIKQLQQYHADCQRINTLCRALRPVGMADDLTHMQHTSRTITDLRAQVQQLDLSNIQALEVKLEELESHRQELEDRRDTMQEEIGKTQTAHVQKQTMLEDRQHSLLNLAESVEVAKQDVAKLQRFSADYDVEAACTRLREEAAGPALRFEAIQQRIEKAEKQASDAKKHFRRIVMENYNPQAKQSELIGLQVDDLDDYRHSGSDFYAVSDAYLQIRQQLHRQRDIGLADVTDRLGHAQHVVNNAFTANFSQLIYDAIIRGEDRLERLNQELRGQKFGDEHYRFGWTWVPNTNTTMIFSYTS